MYDLLGGILFIILSLLARAACPRLTVTKAEANANGNGVYIETTLKVVWAPTKPVYRNIAKNMYLYYNTAPYGWTIGTLDHVNKAWILHSGINRIKFRVNKYIGTSICNYVHLKVAQSLKNLGRRNFTLRRREYGRITGPMVNQSLQRGRK